MHAKKNNFWKFQFAAIKLQKTWKKGSHIGSFMVYIYMGDSQEKYPDQIFTLFIAKDSVFTFLNVVCGHFTFFQLTYIQTGILILIFAA